jgi:hypothetical protein
VCRARIVGMFMLASEPSTPTTAALRAVGDITTGTRGDARP